MYIKYVRMYVCTYIEHLKVLLVILAHICIIFNIYVTHTLNEFFQISYL